jgi:hypothetical protein
MQTVDIANIRAQLKANVATTLDIEGYDYEAKNKHYPCFTVSWPDQLNPRAAHGGVVDLVIPIMFEVIWLGDESSDRALMDLMEAAVNAIEFDSDLNGYCDDVACGPFSDIGSRTLPDDRVVMQFVVPVEIFA